MIAEQKIKKAILLRKRTFYSPTNANEFFDFARILISFRICVNKCINEMDFIRMKIGLQELLNSESVKLQKYYLVRVLPL